jgi:hypothetical protein
MSSDEIATGCPEVSIFSISRTNLSIPTLRSVIFVERSV